MPKPTPIKYGTTRPDGQTKFRPLAARLPEEMHAALEEHARLTGRDKSEVVRDSIARSIGFDVSRFENELKRKDAA